MTERDSISKPTSLDDELVALGLEVLTDPTLDGFMRQGRPLKNLEMHAAMIVRRRDEFRMPQVIALFSQLNRNARHDYSLSAH